MCAVGYRILRLRMVMIRTITVDEVWYSKSDRTVDTMVLDILRILIGIFKFIIEFLTSFSL